MFKKKCLFLSFLQKPLGLTIMEKKKTQIRKTVFMQQIETLSHSLNEGKGSKCLCMEATVVSHAFMKAAAIR